MSQEKEYGKKIQDNISFTVSGPNKEPMSLSVFYDKLNQNIDYIKTAYSLNEKDIKVYLDVYEDANGDRYDSIHLLFIRNETEQEIKNRQYRESVIKDNAVKSLKTLIDNNTKEAIEYLKEKKII